MMKVFKFGGALMKNAAGIRKAGEIIEEFSCQPLLVVVSALGKTTNGLENLLKLRVGENVSGQVENGFFNLKQYHISIIQELFNDDSSPEASGLVTEIEDLFSQLWDDLNKEYLSYYIAYDQIVSYGEQFSLLIVSKYMESRNVNCEAMDSARIIVTDSNYTDARVNWKFTEKTIEVRLIPAIDSHKTIITQGFTAADEKGNITTLGREGSDFTAAIFANILNADELSIWKDVPGLMNADPKRFENTVKLHKISYQEAIELAFYGASVIHPKTIQPLREKNIPLYVRSFYNPASKPSLISVDGSVDESIHKIIVKDEQVLLSITSKNLDFISEDNLTKIFKALSKHKIHINLMQNSAVSFSICFNHEENKLSALIEVLQNQFILRYNAGLQLLTIKHYNDELIKEHIGARKVYLEQKSRSTVQLLLK